MRPSLTLTPTFSVEVQRIFSGSSYKLLPRACLWLLWQIDMSECVVHWLSCHYNWSIFFHVPSRILYFLRSSLWSEPTSHASQAWNAPKSDPSLRVCALGLWDESFPLGDPLGKLPPAGSLREILWLGRSPPHWIFLKKYMWYVYLGSLIGNTRHLDTFRYIKLIHILIS